MDAEKDIIALEQAKAGLRKKLLKVLKELSPHEIERRSRDVEDKLYELPEYIKARKVLFYYPLKGEPDLRGMIRKGLGKKEIFLPVINIEKKEMVPYPIRGLDDLEEGPYKTKQPRCLHPARLGFQNLDFVIVPGLAFTEEGYRLGRGKGYYDRFLALLSKSVPTVGVCFSFQIIEDMPIHSRLDQRVGRVISG